MHQRSLRRVSGSYSSAARMLAWTSALDIGLVNRGQLKPQSAHDQNSTSRQTSLRSWPRTAWPLQAGHSSPVTVGRPHAAGAGIKAAATRHRSPEDRSCNHGNRRWTNQRDPCGCLPEPYVERHLSGFDLGLLWGASTLLKAVVTDVEAPARMEHRQTVEVTLPLRCPAERLAAQPEAARLDVIRACRGVAGQSLSRRTAPARWSRAVPRDRSRRRL